MRSFRSKPVGWQRESYRHYLAARFGSAGGERRKLLPWRQGTISRVQGVPIKAYKIEPGKVYPVTPGDVRRFLERQKKEDVRGLKAVEFVEPKTDDQKGAYAQYVRSRRVIAIFAQPFDKRYKLIDNQPASQVKRHVKEYVLPHELGHHKALYVENITDRSLATAEARADANVVGMHPKDRDVHLLKRM